MIYDAMTRRAFLAVSTTSALAVGAKAKEVRVNTAKVIPGRVSPNEKVNIAAIGAGGKGMSDIMGCAAFKDHVNVVALCDPDWHNAKEAFYRLKDAKQFKDYRNMLDNMGDEIDACTISTPDHTHAPAAATAMRLGKHVYVQKPLTHTVAEARLLTQLAAETGVATQMGNQGHCGNGVRDLCEMIWDGAIGQVKEAHVWTNRPIWPQGLGRPAISNASPEDLDWDTWLGTAPYRPFVAKHPDTDERCYCPFVWRGWWDFGCGALGDMACHIMDPANWALNLNDAKSYTIELITQEGMTDEMAPNKSIIKYSFPARGDMGPVDVFWYDGGLLPERPAIVPENEKLGEGDNGSLFIGENGIISSGTYGGDSRIIPEEQMKAYTMPEQTIKRIEAEDPYLNWIHACKGGDAAASNFSYSGPFTELVSMGNIALRVGGKLSWDAENFTFDNKAANALLTKEYRAGWEIEGLPKVG